MALKTELEELLKVMKPEEAEAQRKLFEAYPQLADGYLRQADYSRQVAEARAARDKADKKYSDNLEWWNSKKPLVDGWEAEKQALTEENLKLKTAVESASKTAVAGQGGDSVDIATVAKAVMDQLAATGGRFTQADIDKIAENKAKAIVDSVVTDKVTSGLASASDLFLKQTFPQVTNFILDSVDLSFEHQREFGKPLNRKELSDFMKANGIAEPKKAYEEMTKQARMDREVERRAEERARQLLTERNGLPGGGAPGATPGAFQIRLSEDPKLDPMAGKEVRVGAGDLARAAAAELAAEGKF